MTKLISIDINCKSGIISPNTGRTVTITVEDAEESDIIEAIGL